METTSPPTPVMTTWMIDDIPDGATGIPAYAYTTEEKARRAADEQYGNRIATWQRPSENTCGDPNCVCPNPDGILYAHDAHGFLICSIVPVEVL